MAISRLRTPLQVRLEKQECHLVARDEQPARLRPWKLSNIIMKITLEMKVQLSPSKWRYLPANLLQRNALGEPEPDCILVDGTMIWIFPSCNYLKKSIIVTSCIYQDPFENPAAPSFSTEKERRKKIFALFARLHYCIKSPTGSR